MKPKDCNTLLTTSSFANIQRDTVKKEGEETLQSFSALDFLVHLGN